MSFTCSWVWVCFWLDRVCLIGAFPIQIRWWRNFFIMVGLGRITTLSAFPNVKSFLFRHVYTCIVTRKIQVWVWESALPNKVLYKTSKLVQIYLFELHVSLLLATCIRMCPNSSTCRLLVCYYSPLSHLGYYDDSSISSHLWPALLVVAFLIKKGMGSLWDCFLGHHHDILTFG